MSIHIVRYSKFQSVGNITLHFPENFGGDTTQIEYIGFKGEATQVFPLPNFCFYDRVGKLVSLSLIMFLLLITHILNIVDS